MADGKTLTASQLLTHFLFPPAKQHTFVGKLSGGERKRLQLMRVLMKNPNYLILDEPTNDLDIDTLNVLEDFLEKYSGVLILVSHDRYLMDKLTNQLFILDGDSQVKIYNGNYTDYRLEKEEESKNKGSVKKTEGNPQETQVSKKNKLTFKEEKELENIEKQISEIEQKILSLSGDLNSSLADHVLLNTISREIQESKNLLDTISLRWLELIELKEN